MTWLPLFACLTSPNYPDRRAAEEYRVEAHFSGLRRWVFGVKWPDPPAFRILPAGALVSAGRSVHLESAVTKTDGPPASSSSPARFLKPLSLRSSVGRSISLAFLVIA